MDSCSILLCEWHLLLQQQACFKPLFTSTAVHMQVGGTLPGGIILRGLSGGERKRLSIATGIMSTPCIVFLDEPTSGLDSFAALSVMSYMKTMAAGGQTVVSSIHQPRAAIWALFDSVSTGNAAGVCAQAAVLSAACCMASCIIGTADNQDPKQVPAAGQAELY